MATLGWVGRIWVTAASTSPALSMFHLTPPYKGQRVLPLYKSQSNLVEVQCTNIASFSTKQTTGAPAVQGLHPTWFRRAMAAALSGACSRSRSRNASFSACTGDIRIEMSGHLHARALGSDNGGCLCPRVACSQSSTKPVLRLSDVQGSRPWQVRVLRLSLLLLDTS